jgi:CRISPR-associated protein Cas1
VWLGREGECGFLHELDDSKELLVYGLQELYRGLVDLSAVQLLEERKLKKSDFVVAEKSCY